MWPLLDAWPNLKATSIDLLEQRIRDLQAVHNGGLVRLTAIQANAENMVFPAHSYDVVTMLEVLEYMPHPEMAIKKAIAIARKAVIISVPSKPDDNPEHIHLFDEKTLRTVLHDSGARPIAINYVLNHIVILAFI